MNYKNYQFILLNEDTSISKTLLNAPAGWADLERKHIRNEIYHGVMPSITSDLRFPYIDAINDGGGFYFLKDAFDSKGVKAKVSIQIKELNRFTNQYESSFTGYFDFSPEGGYSEQDEWIEISLIESNKLHKLLTRDEIDSNLFSLVSLDNITIPNFTFAYDSINFLPIDIYLKCISSGESEGSGLDTSTGFDPAIVEINYKGDISLNEVGKRISISSPATDTIYSNTLDSSSTIKVETISGSFNFIYLINVPNTTTTWNLLVNYKLIAYNSNDTVNGSRTTLLNTFNGIGDSSGTLTGSYESNPVAGFDSINVPSGGYLKFFIEFALYGSDIFGTNGLEISTFAGASFFNIDNFILYEKTAGQPTNSIRGLYLHRALDRSIQLNTSELNTNKLLYAPDLGWTSPYNFRVYPTKGEWANEFFTNGWQLRKFTGRALNANFRDLFKSFSSYNPSGMYYDKTNDYIVIDKIENFYKLEPFVNNLGSVRNLRITLAKEFFYSSIKSGYPKTENEDFSGVNEFNTETEHSISIETKNSLDLRSPYRQASVDIELLRRANIYSYASKDTKNDDNGYIVSTNGTSTLQGQISDMTGIINIEQYYNQTKTPRQNLQKWGILYESPLFKDITEVISFRKSVKDTEVTYTDPLTGNIVSEFDDISQYFSDTCLVWPLFYEFEAPYTKSIRDELDADPHRYYLFSDKDSNSLYGFVWEISGNPYKEIATYKLLALNLNRLP